MHTLRTKLIVAGLLVVIAASAVSVVGHADVLWPRAVPMQKEVSAPVRSFVPQSITSDAAARIRATYQASTTPESPFITLMVGDKTYRAAATSTQTILAVMRTLADTTDFSFSGKEFPGMGFFVEEIDHQKSANGAYWMLYVNMLAAQKGVSQTLVSPGDVILWRYEKNRHAI